MEDIHQRKIACVEYLDRKMGDLLGGLGELGVDVTVVVCGDHGDCLGEDGLYGHGFYHPKVMEVPMLLFRSRSDGRVEPEGWNEPGGEAAAPDEPAARPRRRRRHGGGVAGRRHREG
jgi:hypothetical protein